MVRRPNRSEVAVEQTWNLEGLYATAADWEAEVGRVEGLFPDLAGFAGRLGNGPADVLACLKLNDEVQMRAEQAGWFAQNRYAEDQGDPIRVGMLERAMRLGAGAQTAGAFIKPELLALEASTVRAWFDQEPGLALYRQFLEDLLAEKAHMLGTEAEAVLAEVAPLLQAPFDIWQQTTNVDLRFDPIVNEQGEQVPMSLGGWLNYSSSPVREVRQAAEESFQRAYGAHRNTIGAAVAAATRRDSVVARLRKYPSALSAALAREHMPEEVFHNLLRVCEAGTVQYRRHLDYKRRAMGLDQLMPWDLRAQVGIGTAAAISFDDAFAMIREALAPLGAEYGAMLERAYAERWVDWADNEGKGGNAYSSGCYGYHPAVKIQWHGTLLDVFTLCHELGHALHSWFTNQSQPYVYSHYTVALAETASTTNEILLARHLMAKEADPEFKRAVLGMALTSFDDNLFYAAAMAKLQQELHAAAEEGKPLTCESITAINTEIMQHWYGDVAAVTPEGLGARWNWMIHNFLDFYGYQYALGISAAAAFAEAILTEGEPAAARYLGFLRAGSSAHPLEILRAAGLDMTTPQPVERAIAVYGALIDRLEA